MKCSMCDQKALYRVHSLGFCKHHAEAAKIIPQSTNVQNKRALRLHFKWSDVRKPKIL